MEMRKEDFSNKYFSGGGEQLQAKLQSYIEESNKLCQLFSLLIMETISIDRNIQVFKKVFEAESRIIFSTKFGDGKSYF